MKSIAHAWTGLYAIQRIKNLMGHFKDVDEKGKPLDHKKHAKKFIEYFDKHKDAFVQGAWFPDSVIQDNLAGAHTYKLEKPKDRNARRKAVEIKNRTPSHLSMKTFFSAERYKEKVVQSFSYTLPDRCEALSHAIRDMMKIQYKEKKGSDIIFNDDQVTLYFLMLAHYLADAHVPPHSDKRDFYGPSKVHPDMEEYWDEEILKFYKLDKKRKVFDYDIYGEPELQQGMEEDFKKSFLYKALKRLESKTRRWDPSDSKLLGRGNKKIYDYIKAVCFTSYLVSTEFIPYSVSEALYKKLNIRNDSPYKERLEELSVDVMADAIDSTAMVWLLTWEKLNKLDDELKAKTKEIKASGGKVVRS